MAISIKRVEYFFSTVKDRPGEAYNLLALLKDLGINMFAFTAVPVGPSSTQLAVFPEDIDKFISEAKLAGMALDGPHDSILVQGDDELGALAGIHEILFKANINVYASSGVADGRGGFGYLIYIKPEDFDLAIKALDL